MEKQHQPKWHEINQAIGGFTKIWLFAQLFWYLSSVDRNLLCADSTISIYFQMKMERMIGNVLDKRILWRQLFPESVKRNVQASNYYMKCQRDLFKKKKKIKNYEH